MEIKSLTGVRGVFALYVVLFHLVNRDFGGKLDSFLMSGYISVDFFLPVIRIYYEYGSQRILSEKWW